MVFEMLNNKDDNFDDIDLDELFTDFNEERSYTPRQPLIKWGLNSKTNQDDLIEFNENDCTAPRINRKRTKNKNKTNAKQMTMYDYASSISYRHKQFYSSLDNSTTTKTIIKGQKRPLTEDQQPSTSISKKSKIDDYDKLSSPDFIDNLLQYLDDRSHNIMEQQPLQKDDIKKRKVLLDDLK